MSVLLEEAPSELSTSDSDLTHVFCYCTPEVSFCGTPVVASEIVEDPDLETTCVVCADLERVPCQRCGGST